MEDKDFWNKKKAMCNLLQLIGVTLGDDIIQPIDDFISSRVTKESSLKDKCAGLVILGSIIKGPSTDRFSEILSPSLLKIILGFYEDESERLKEITSWFFLQLGQYHQKSIINRNVYPILVNKIEDALQKGSAEVAYYSALLVKIISKIPRCDEDETKEMIESSYSKLIYSSNHCAYRMQPSPLSSKNSIHKINIASFEALCSLFESPPSEIPKFMREYIYKFHETLKETCKVSNLNPTFKEIQSLL